MIDWLIQPAVPFSIVLALAYTAGLHLAMRLGYKHFLRHWLAAIAGMAIGAGAAVRIGSRLPTLGDMHILEMSAAAIILLLLAGVAVLNTPPEKEPAGDS